jgi:hypothetical protein
VILSYILYGGAAFAALLFYAWLEGLWFWSRPQQGAIDLDVAADRPPPPPMTHDLNHIEGKTK